MYRIKIILLSLLCVFTACAQQGNDRKEFTNPYVRNINNKAEASFFRQITHPSKEELLQLQLDLKKALDSDVNYQRTYVNLIRCVEMLNSKPFEQSANFYDTQLGTFSAWLSRHPNDLSFLVNRGVVFEMKGDKISAKKDFAKGLNLLNIKNITIKNGMSSLKIEEAVNFAFFYLKADDRKKALGIINQLNKFYPNNTLVSSCHSILNNRSREEIIYKKASF